MNIAVIQFPGSNCERETKLAIQRAHMQTVEFLWNDPVDRLLACDGYVIVGGFSYEDRSRAGIIAALDPLMSVLKTQSALGKPVLGICNGAQILLEAGLVPGLDSHQGEIALTDNKRMQQGKVLGTGYYNAWIHLTLAKNQQNNAFTRLLRKDDVSCLNMPVAHAEGRFMLSNELLDLMETQGLVVFQYCDEQGQLIDEFPINPNGSVNNIAAITNPAGNVLAMMPHPERTSTCDGLFHSMRDYIAERKVTDTASKTNAPASEAPCYEQNVVKSYEKKPHTDEIRVQLMIADNHALSVENTLRKQGLPVTIKRQIHWEISEASPTVLEQILASGLLFNERKEMRVTQPQNDVAGQCTVLVRAKEDMRGQAMQQQLQELGIDGFNGIRYGVLWQVSTESSKLAEVMAFILKTHILFNPFSHECFTDV